MSIITFSYDFVLHCIPASSFPQAVAAAFTRLHQLYPPGAEATYYGVSSGNERGGIDYMAAVHLHNAETAAACTLPQFRVRAGRYLSAYIPDFMTDVSKIGSTFAALMKDPRIAVDGYCLEEYPNPSDVRCMVLLQ